VQEDVGALQISMENFNIMEGLQPAYDLDEYAPDFVLSYVALLLLMCGNFLEQITVIRVLHDDAKTAAGFVDKCFFIRADVRMFDTGKNTNFIEGIFLLFVGELDHFDFLESVDFAISQSFNLVD